MLPPSPSWWGCSEGRAPPCWPSALLALVGQVDLEHGGLGQTEVEQTAPGVLGVSCSACFLGS